MNNIRVLTSIILSALLVACSAYAKKNDKKLNRLKDRSNSEEVIGKDEVINKDEIINKDQVIDTKDDCQCCPKSCSSIAYNPAPCCCQKTCELLLRGDFLYWKGSLCGLDGAFGNTSIVTSDNVTTVEEFDQEPEFKWEPAFRVGMNILHNCFDLEFDWTDFRGGACHSGHGQGGKWKINYDLFDLTLGYRFNPCCYFHIKPFIGLKGADIDQTLHSFLRVPITDTTGESIAISKMHDKEEFWGLGPQVGVDVDWYIGCNLSFYCTIDAVNYYGHVHGKYNDVDIFTSSENVSHLRKKHCFNTFGTDGAIGFRWDKYTCGCDCRAHFLLKVGAEQHRIYDFSNLGSDGSLSLDGLVVEGGIGLVF
jgi:hypothetical protein